MTNRSPGFSYVELTMGLAIVLTLAGISLIGFKQVSALWWSHSAENLVSSKLRQARQMAVSQRKNVVISFADPNEMKISVQTAPNTFALVEEIYLPAGYTYSEPTGSSTPGNLTSLKSLRSQSFMYFGDGSARDSAGNPLNGVVYLSRANSSHPHHAKAVTIVGSTGRVRSHRPAISNSNVQRSNQEWEDAH